MKISALIDQIGGFEATKLENELAEKQGQVNELGRFEREHEARVDETQKRKDMDLLLDLKGQIDKRIRMESPVSPGWETWD